MQSGTLRGEPTSGQLWGRVVCQAPECGYSEAGYLPTLARLHMAHQALTGHTSQTVTADPEGEARCDPTGVARPAGTRTGKELAEEIVRAALVGQAHVDRRLDELRDELLDELLGPD